MNLYPTKAIWNFGGKIVQIDGFIDLDRPIRDRVNTSEEVVNNTGKKILLDAGVRTPGQTIRINHGHHKGFVGVIDAIYWTEAEVKCEKNDRIFSLWHNQNLFTVLDPSDAPPPKAAIITASPQPAPEPPLAVPNPSPVSDDLTPPSEPANRPTAWIPKRI